MTQHFLSPQAFADFMLTYDGPTCRLSADGGGQGERLPGAIVALATDTNQQLTAPWWLTGFCSEWHQQ